MRFTFHYGSILIDNTHDISHLSDIYIPLWFYSNESIKKIFEERKKFTFHYGSILILAFSLLGFGR